MIYLSISKYPQLPAIIKYNRYQYQNIRNIHNTHNIGISGNLYNLGHGRLILLIVGLPFFIIHSLNTIPAISAVVDCFLYLLFISSAYVVVFVGFVWNCLFFCLSYFSTGCWESCVWICWDLGFVLAFVVTFLFRDLLTNHHDLTTLWYNLYGLLVFILLLKSTPFFWLILFISLISWFTLLFFLPS